MLKTALASLRKESVLLQDFITPPLVCIYRLARLRNVAFLCLCTKNTMTSNSSLGWSSICSYGCFFGKSQPSVAHRVLESKAKRLQLMNSSRAPNRTDHNHMLVVRRPKAHELKASRDYSSILLSVFDGVTKKPKPLDECQRKSCELGRTKLPMPRNKVPDQHIKMPPKLVKSTVIPRSDQASCSTSLTAKTIKRKSEEKIDDSVQLKKEKVTQNRLTSSDHVHKAAASLSKQGKQLQEPTKAKAKANVNRVVPRKVLQPSSQNKNKELNEAATKAAPSSKLNRPPPTKQHMGPKQKPADKAKSFSSTHEVDTSYISSLCQNLFRRNHHKNEVHDDDDDDDCMVSSFSEILKEERRSEKLARKEDQIELLRLQREERDEKLRGQAKKQQKLQ